MFIGRKKELKSLDTLYKRGRFELVILYGRRRVGKTTLISEFVKDKLSVRFTALDTDSAEENLRRLSAAMKASGLCGDESKNFETFEEALDFLFKLSLKRRFILVIDEYQYLALCDKSVNSVLKDLIDEYCKSSKMMLILCSSSISYVKERIMAYKAPLFGRVTAQLKIQPFGFNDTAKFFPNRSWEEKAVLYGLFGGTPFYLDRLDPSEELEKIVKDTFLNQVSHLSNEPLNLLRQEVWEVDEYGAVLETIAKGASKLSEIANGSGESVERCLELLGKLTELGYVRRESPYGEKERRGNTLYLIDDNLFRFWYTLVRPNEFFISADLEEATYSRIKPHLDTYMGKVFEEICQEYLWLLQKRGEFPLGYADLGRWWGNDPNAKKQTEIGIMGEADKENAFFAECKWTNRKVEAEVLETLIQRSRLFHYKNNHYFIFSKSGFTSGCIQRAQEIPNTHLISFGDMCAVFAKS